MFIITAVGRDRPGMANAIAERLAELGCNLEDTTMTRLSGEFAMILIVEEPQGADLQVLAQSLKPLEISHGLFVNVRDIDETNTFATDETSRFIVTVYGPDKVGLLAGITSVFTRHGANLTDVQSRVASAGSVYVMIFEIELAPQTNAENLETDLQETAQELGVSLSLRALDEDVI